MELSIFLAKLMGLYLIIISAAVLIRRKEIDESLVAEFFKNRGFVFFSGALILILGLLVVLNHNIWELSWRGLITFLGWLTVAKGVTRLFVMNAAIKASSKLVKGHGYTIILTISLLVGIWLTYIGFTL